MADMVYTADAVLRAVPEGYMVEKDRYGSPGVVLRREEVSHWLAGRRGRGALVLVLS
jgi:hypothetical protein